MVSNPALHLRFDAFELYEADARVLRAGIPVPVPPRAFAVLCTLARQPGQLVTRDALLDAVWGHRHVSEAVLVGTIAELRAALADEAPQPRYIETVERRGYRFIGQVSEIPSAASLAWHAAGKVLLDRDVGASAVAPLIGREAALAQLRDAWRKAQAGARQLVWVTGDAGIGKTLLIERFVSELGAGVATYGRCVEDFGAGEPYLPILKVLQDLCRRDPALVAHLRSVAPTWLVQMPWLTSDAERAQLYADLVGVHPDRMVRELREFMDRVAADRPQVFILEDLDLSDAGTLRMMEHFARRPREVRLLWVATFRPTRELAADHPLRVLRQDLKRQKLCREIVLEPLSEAEVRAYLAGRMSGIAASESFVRRVHAHTGGLPLFVANAVDAIVADPATQDSRDGPLALPDSLSGMIEQQVARLPEELQHLLEAACVLGVEFRASHLAALLARDMDGVCDECDQLVRRALWLRLAGIDECPDGSIDPRYAFLHAMYRQVFYRRAPEARREPLHRRALVALETARAAGTLVPLAELAFHAEHAHQFAQALRCYAEAADDALAHFAPREVLVLAAAGLKLLGRVADGQERVELELRLTHRRGVASAQLFGIGAAETTAAFDRSLALCESLPPTLPRALLLSGLGLMRFEFGDYAGALQLADRLLAIAEQRGDDILRVSAALLTGRVRSARGEPEAARVALAAGLDACARCATLPAATFAVDPCVALHAHIAIPLMALGRGDQARRHVALAHARAREIMQPGAQTLALWVDGMLAVRGGDPMKVIECATVLGRIVAKSMLTQFDGPAHWLRGWALAQAGKAHEGKRLIRAGLEVQARLGIVAGNTETLGFAAEALIRAQDWVHADRQLEEALELAERLQERAAIPYLLRLRAEVAIALDDPERARELLRTALATARRQGASFEELKCLYSLHQHALANSHERSALRQVFAAQQEARDLPFMKQVAAALK